MTCQSCGHETPAAHRFCEQCGAALVRRCGTCGSDVSPAAKFCGGCGTALVSGPTEKAEARKVVTIVFADLIGSTALHERLDPESVRRVMERYHGAVRVPVEAHGGTVVQLLGDGVMCAFGVPYVGEDDAIRAVRAAVGIQQAFRDFAREHAEVVGNVGLRVAVNTGEVVVSDDYAAGIGDPLNVAARLQQEARDGDVLIGESTERLVRDRVTLERFGTFNLKGRSETVTAYRVVSLERPAGVAATPFVGREDELRRINAVYDAAVGARRARLAVILGSPGLGKSRLMAEFARRLGYAATVLAAHCDAAGGATFAPLVEALRTLLRADDRISGDDLRGVIDTVLPRDDPEHGRIAAGVAALLSGTPSSPEETFFIVRRFLAAFAAGQPVVLAIDDLQWAEPLLLDLTEHLVQWSSDVPLFVLVAARPELRDTRSSLATPGGLVSEVVTLAGLDAAAATRLAANVIGADALPAAVAGRVLATSEGNPLFVGELVRMLVHEGALKREGDRWTADVELSRLEMPPTIQALLAARIERLRPEERTVLERAAVVGRQFSRAAVTHLLPREITDLDARLEALRRSELIEPDAGWFLGEPVLRFHHVLIRDAAYRRILKNTRAELHGRFAEWLEARVAQSVEHDETIGWHLEQAHRHLRELGPIDEHGRALGERAARYLAAAGRRALARDDLPVAANLLGRALDRLDPADSTRADLALDWCEALLAAGDVAPAAKAIEELGRWIDDTTSPESPAPSPRLQAWHTCFTGQLAALTDPQTLRATADAVAAAADELAAAGDDAGEAKAHSVHAEALSRLGKVGQSEAALDRALAAARRGDDRRRSNAVLAGAPLAALWGPSPVTRASGRCLDVVRVLRITQGAPAVEAVALRCQGVLEALRGRTEAARRMIAASRRMVEELGLTQGLLETEMSAGLVELIEGDDAAAERSLRTAYDGFRDHGLAIDAARAAALLGRSLLPQGRAAEAEALSHESEALAGDDLQAAITWRRVRAEALALRGEHAAAVELARSAVEIAAATDALLHHAEARLALAAALRAAGRSDEAAAEEARAIELWEAKGATLPAERARQGAGRVEATALAPAQSGAAPATNRRVRANAATGNAARFEAAIAARDADALVALVAGGSEVMDHTTGAMYDWEGLLPAWRSLMRAEDATYGQEPLATLGDSLALYRQRTSGSGVVGEKLDVGAWQTEKICLIEVDAQGRRGRTEIFAADRLGDAVARLYERYAELLAQGPERTRAAATARSVAALPLGGAYDDDRLARLFDENLDARGTAYAPAVEYLDHRTVGMGSVRGAQALREYMRALISLMEDSAARVDDVLALQSDAFLLRWTHFGTDRASGGAFERRLCHLWIFGADGLVTRAEQFDAEQDTEALARFDELVLSPARPEQSRRVEGLTAEPPALRPVRCQVRPNAATAHFARLDAAVAARDADALAVLLPEETEVIDHTTGATWGRSGQLESYRRHLRTQNLAWSSEPLVTLGDSLALCRLSVSGSGATGPTFDVGAFETNRVTLTEVDAQARRLRAEVFFADHLGDAIARMYERYAELLPEGPERARAAATARSVAALTGSLDVDRWATAIAPEVVAVDHRPLGLPPLHGAEAFLGGLRSLLDLVDDTIVRVDDVLGVRPDALLVRWTNLGTQRAGGGAYERNILALRFFGADGLLTRYEMFASDDGEQALARFDEIILRPEPAPAGSENPMNVLLRTSSNRCLAPTFIGSPSKDPSPAKRLAAEPPRPIRRRVRPNAATAIAARMVAAFDARDADALAALCAESCEVIHHPTGTSWERAGFVTSSRAFFAAQAGTFRLEPLATLGDSLALCRQSVSASGIGGRKFDVGAYEIEEIALIEADAYGQYHRGENFAAKRLGDAVARFYERYANLLPEGPERTRAAATARSVAALLGPPDRWPFAAEVEFTDHRTVGLGSVHGAEAVVRGIRALIQLSDDFFNRVDGVLALRSDALLVLWMNSGTDRASGGFFERSLCELWVFGADGLVTRWEQFDAEQEAEALARFDELTAEPAAARFAGAPSPTTEKLARRVRPNAATANAARTDSVIAARDTEALPDLFADEMRAESHITHTAWDRSAVLSSWRSLLLAQDPACRHELLAILGDSLALCRVSLGAGGLARGNFDVGPYEKPEIHLIEVDAQGRRRWTEVFAIERLGDAIVRLYERYAELLPQGPGRDRAAAVPRSLGATLGPLDLDRFVSAMAPGVEYLDHRMIVGVGSAHGIQEFRAVLHALFEIADDLTNRVDDVLALRSDALLLRATNFGTDRAAGGIFERQFLALHFFGANGLATHMEQFDVSHEAEALARFDEVLTASAPAARVENAATRLGDRFAAAWAARDWEGIAASFAADFRLIDRRRYAHLELDRDQHLESLRFRFEMSSSRTVLAAIATRGRRLALLRQRFELAGGDVGPSETESLNVAESDEHGHFVALVTFDPDDLDAAHAELDARYVAGEAAPFVATMDTMQRFEELRPDPARIPPNAAWRARERAWDLVRARDWEGLRALVTADFTYEDRQKHALLSGDVEVLIRSGQEATSWPGWHVSNALLGTAGDRIMVERWAWTGAPDTGAFEMEHIRLVEVAADGRLVAWINFDLEDRSAAFAEAHARFVAGEAAAIGGQAPVVALARAFARHDWVALRGCLAPDAVLCDRRAVSVFGAIDGDQWVALLRTFEELAPDVGWETLRILTWNHRGRVDVSRQLGTMRDGGPFEHVFVRVFVTDGPHIQRYEFFDLADTDQAVARFAELCRVDGASP